MADWSGVYNFDSSSDLTTRVRRLERGEQYLRAGQLVTPSGSYAGVPTTLLDNGRIDLTSPDLTTKGSIPPAGVVGNFGFTATTTSITAYWDGTNGSTKLRIVRTDGSAVQIPTGTMTISGLSANTQYGLLPFWSPFNNCGIGWIKGDSGTDPNKFAFSAAAMTITNSVQQVYQKREPLSNGFLKYTTPTSGTNSGGGTGGGYGGGCVILGTDIKPLGDIGYNTVHYKQTDWYHIACEDYPRTLNCTPDHAMYHAERGKVHAEQLKVGDKVITEHGERTLSAVQPFYRDCTKVEVKMFDGHLYYANGYLSHNYKLF